jgi:hypothetical protein
MEGRQLPAEIDRAFGVSWVAYAPPVARLALTISLGLVIAANVHAPLGGALMLVGLTWGSLRILHLRSIVLFTDHSGVWLYRGIFPWDRGVVGVKWRDLSDASYDTSLWSWLSRSYRLRIEQRFTKSSEIVLASIANGDEAAEYINLRHREMLATELMH